MAKKSKRFDYFDAFQRQAELAAKEARLLIETIENYDNDLDIEQTMLRAHEIEHEGDEISHEVFTAIATDFITPIEREDIMSLTNYLDDILDYIEDVIQRFYMYDVESMHADSLAFAQIIEKSCHALENSMDDFRNFKKSKNFRQRLIDINSFEEEADQFYMQIIRDMHVKEKNNPVHILIWSQLFARMEKCTDACEHTADTMRTVMLKNS